MKVGLSLSFCVSEIIDGKVSIDEVAFISSGTRVLKAHQWDEVISHYRTSYWRKNPDEGERIARRLINEGKIIQPRAEMGKSVGLNDGSVWIEQEEYNEFARRRLSMRARKE